MGRIGFCLLIALLAAPVLASGTEVDLVGKVEESRTIVHRKARSALYYVRLRVAVESVESGRELIRGAKEIDVRCWREVGSDAAVLEGHSSIPADGARFRARLVRHHEGFFEPAGPDALAPIDGFVEREFPVPARRQLTTGTVLGGLAGLLALAVAGFVYWGKRTV